jgi:uncharacterized protein YbjT (DUF2867 family)
MAMTISKHTPGPWKIGETFSDGDIQILIPNEMGTVCMVHNHAAIASDPDFMEEQAQANARLIAAAPELLELVKHVAGLSTVDASLAEWAERLIAKAEGR